MNYIKEITLKENNMFEQLENLNGKQCYDKFGLKEDESIKETVTFENGYFADVKMCVCDEEYTCFAECVLFNKEGGQVALTEPMDSVLGEWDFEVGEDTYKIIVKSERPYQYSYYLNEETGLLTVYENNCVLSTVQGVSKDMAEEIFKEDVFNIAGVEL